MRPAARMPTLRRLAAAARFEPTRRPLPDHRAPAASGHAPENTMAALERVVAMGCVEVETDVCFAKDGRLLLLHDDTIDRTTDGSGRPEDFTLDELERLDAASLTDERLSRDRDYSGENPITLEERLDAFGTARRITSRSRIRRPASFPRPSPRSRSADCPTASSSPPSTTTPRFRRPCVSRR